MQLNQLDHLKEKTGNHVKQMLLNSQQLINLHLKFAAFISHLQIVLTC